MNFHFFKAIPFGGGSYGVGVLSKFPMDRARTIRLPKRNDIKSEDRIVGLVRVELPGKDTLYFASTHWDVVSEENRILQAEKACEELQQLNHPVILAGDLNTRKMSRSIAVLKTTFTLASKQFAPTIPSDQPDRRIDYVVYAKDQDFSLISEEVLFNQQTQKASDHLPVVADLQVQ
jgi:endonuclease/exonuclease/phosphatase family metal-dependent hydrolase